MKKVRFGSLIFCFCVVTSMIVAQEDQPNAKYSVVEGVPRNISPPNDFVVPDSLAIEVFAASPMIHSPVAMDVDPQGRLWIIEDNRGSRVTVLADTDHDGKADKATPFGVTFRSICQGIAVFDNRIVLAMAPDLIVYTDVNRNAVFDEGIDKREVILTGFHGRNHDHALHAVNGGPDGRWYFTHGNKGADIKTIDGKEFHASSYYSDNPNSIGLKSSDGHMYVGGFGLSILPDGSDAKMFFHNARNTHDTIVTSMGDVLQSDNDDPAHARATWVMRHSNFGYASLEDGSRSWEESAKSWEEREVTYQQIGRSAGKVRVNDGHWRQNNPGTTPIGHLWGSGAPTGNTMIEGDELGTELRGTYLICETVNQALFAFRPKQKETELDIGTHAPLLAVKPGKKSDLLPTDVVQGLDGALYLADWNSSRNRRGKGGPEGAIYVIRKKGHPAAAPPAIDYSTTAGQLAALRSPAVNTRWVAAEKLKRDATTAAAVRTFYEETSNPYYKARAIWILAHTDAPYIEKLLKDDDFETRLVALRALLAAYPGKRVDYLTRMAADTSPAVRLEVAVNLRDVPYAECKTALRAIIAGYDGQNRWYLEALGTAATGKTKAVYNELVRSEPHRSVAQWGNIRRNLAWRLQTKESLDDLTAAIILQKPAIKDFRVLAAGLSMTYTPEQRAANHARLTKLKKQPAFAGDEYQQTIDEFLLKDVIDTPAGTLSKSYIFPATYSGETKVSSVDAIAELKGNADNGRSKMGLCITCHKIGGAGVSFGPNLSHWGQTRDVKVIVDNIVNPAAQLAHGYEKPLVIHIGNHRMEGIDAGYSHHAGAIKVKTVGGLFKKIAFRRNRARIERLEKHSWMPSAAKLGLSDQDVRDIAEYLKTLDPSQDGPARFFVKEWKTNDFTDEVANLSGAFAGTG